MIGYIFALLPLYVVVYVPLSQMIWGPSNKQSSSQQIVEFNSSFIADDEPLSCPPHSYSTFILSHEPLIIYIEDFLSASESEHLVKISEDKYTPSTISHGSETTTDHSIRRSEVALLERDSIVRCIEHRARAFQGWRPNLHIERLRTQRYGEGGHYAHHYDWSGARREADRVSTFMVYVDVSEDVDGGGTEFPRVKMPSATKGTTRGMSRWCKFLVCSDGGSGLGEEMGVTFRPVRGNAVFWENLGLDGRGCEETFHAGLPVTKGTKVGLNIWSWGPARG